MSWTLEERLRRVLRRNHKQRRHAKRIALQVRIRTLRMEADDAEAHARRLRSWLRRMERALENGEYE